MFSLILRHVICAARRPKNFQWHKNGIKREIPLAIFRAEVAGFKVLYALV